MLLALLLPDPTDAQCPEAFKAAARVALRPPLSGPRGPSDEDLRQALLKFIADFANWDAASDSVYLTAARALVKAAHGDESPLIVDPFAGGGSIPLEALRLGCDTFATDLNPVACLILHVLLDDITRHGRALAGEVRRVSAEVRAAVEKELSELYPLDPDGARPIAYLWARTVTCESPDCGAEIPLARSFWLSNKPNRSRALRYSIERPKGSRPQISFEVFKPEAESSVPRGTVSRAKATCPACGIVLPPERVRAQLTDQHGGADVVLSENGSRSGGARLLAVVTLKPGEPGRHYRLPGAHDYAAVARAIGRLKQALTEKPPDTLSRVPDEPLGRVPVSFGVINVWVYGIVGWGDLFTARQKLTLTTFVAEIMRLPETTPLEKAVKRALGLALDRCTDRNSSVTKWDMSSENIGSTFSRQALPMVWDFAEVAPLAGASGDWSGMVEWIAAVTEGFPGTGIVGQTQRADAIKSPLPASASSVWFTDPPYYDAVPYSCISDFFYVWLRRSVGKLHPDLFGASLTEKSQEIVAYIRPTDKAGEAKKRFEAMLTNAFGEGRRVLRDDGIGCIVFAHKTTEGWEALLSGIIRSGWVITASWPITTEMGTRLRARDSAVLAASVHLVCRPRYEPAGVGDWGDILRALPRRIDEWMDRLAAEGIRGADLVFACIGPALELFSRYRVVETPEGEVVALAANLEARTDPARRGYLSYVWEVVGRTALARVLRPSESATTNGGAGVLEEDARLTALFLWTVQSTKVTDDEGEAGQDAESTDDTEDEEDGGTKRRKGLTLIYDVARRFAQPLGIHLDQWEARIIETDKGVVRLLPVRERAPQLFGEAGASAVARRIETAARAGGAAAQGTLFPELAQSAAGVTRRGHRAGRRKGGERIEDLETRRDATTLDRVHAAMLFQDSGATNALRSLLQSEIERGPEFLRLANALSALYPAGSEEKRLLDAMLLAVPRP